MTKICPLCNYPLIYNVSNTSFQCSKNTKLETECGKHSHYYHNKIYNDIGIHLLKYTVYFSHSENKTRIFDTNHNGVILELDSLLDICEEESFIAKIDKLLLFK